MKQDTLPPSALYWCQTRLALHQMHWQELGASSAHGFAALSSLCYLTVTSLAKQEPDRAVSAAVGAQKPPCSGHTTRTGTRL